MQAPSSADDVLSGSLVEIIGQMVYEKFDAPKYRVVLYLTTGLQLDKQATVALVSTLCNVLYCLLILGGFLGCGPLGVLGRQRMLAFTVLSLYVGPALVLIFLAAGGGVLALFALFPMSSVVAITICFFLTSTVANRVGVALGLDQDKDGDVDFADVVKWAALRPWGRALRLDLLHAVLNHVLNERSAMEQALAKLERIDRKLDEADRKRS
jgi:hypothetical protein